MTEKMFARRSGPSPRRLQTCPRELKVLKHITTKISKSRTNFPRSILEEMTSAWEAATSGRCKLARKRTVKVVKATASRLWGTYPGELRRRGLVY